MGRETRPVGGFLSRELGSSKDDPYFYLAPLLLAHDLLGQEDAGRGRFWAHPFNI